MRDVWSGLHGGLGRVKLTVAQTHPTSHPEFSAMRPHWLHETPAMILAKKGFGERLEAGESRAESWSFCVSNRLKGAGGSHFLLRASDTISEVHSGLEAVSRHRK